MLFHRCSNLILMEMSSIHHFLHSRYLDLIIEYLSSVGQGSSVLLQLAVSNGFFPGWYSNG